MLKKLQRRFVLIAMTALSFLLLVQLCAVNVVNIYQRDSELCETLEIIADNNGSLPDGLWDRIPGELGGFLKPFAPVEFNIETPYSTRYFVVELKNNGRTEISTEHIAAVTDRMAYDYAVHVCNTAEPGFGLLGVYRYYYKVTQDSQLIVFIDAQKEFASAASLVTTSIVVGIITLIAILLPVTLFCKMAVRPVAQAIEKQKQFITDASHELKTPLAIISADAEVIELTGGESEWLSSIKNQTQRMSVLIKNLVNLSKIDEVQEGSKKEVFNISQTVEEMVDSFETKAKHDGKNLQVTTAPDLKFYGSQEEIIQLVSILCDNALKYSDEGGTIRVSLYKSGKHICIDCFNTCENLDPASVSRLFDRFYRADESRSRETGGYGIGLSVAKAIAERHRGKIRAVSFGTTGITFKVLLPMNSRFHKDKTS
ncbi:MAG: GHKL domain-containing protein [Clostridia bacterium]|nr:GHKL domain-containing protein [Clostridia bacterium]